jgi:hypothetical protein
MESMSETFDDTNGLSEAILMFSSLRLSEAILRFSSLRLSEAILRFSSLNHR